MKKIEIIDHCFGKTCFVDGIELFVDVETNSSETHVSQIKEKQNEVLENFILLKDKFSEYDWCNILELITQYDDSFTYDHENSKSDSCETCGDWNSNSIYNRM